MRWQERYPRFIDMMQFALLQRFSRTPSARKMFYVVLQDHIDGNPIAGVFRKQSNASNYADEICAKYPDCTVEIWPCELNQKLMMRGGKRYK